ncbi:MAG: hypothetical protein WCF16_07155, partial [Alphaproteobacteria bacterium]
TVPLLTDNRPVWFLQARSPRYQKLAGLYDAALQYLWDYRDAEDFLADAVTDDLLAGNALVKTFWDEDEEEVDFMLVDPATFCVAPGYTDLWKAAWCGERGRKAMTWIRDAFPDTWQNVTPEGYDPTRSQPLGECFDIELENMFAEVYQIWIRDESMREQMIKDSQGEPEDAPKKKYPNGRIIVFTASTVLSDEPSPFDHGKPPYIHLRNYKIPHKFWAMGEVEQIRELHKEINTQLQAIVRQGRVGENPNYEYDTELIDIDSEQLKAEFFNGGMFIPSRRSPDGESAIRKIDTGGIDRRHIEVMNLLRMAIREMSSVTEITQGLPPKKERQSASEIGAMLESSYTRIRQKVRNLEHFIKRWNWQVVSLMQQYYTEERYIAFKEETEEGQVGAWDIISNKPETVKNLYKPQPMTDEEGEPEAPEEYEKRLANDEDYQFMLKTFEGEKQDRVHFPFLIQVQSSSTLPKDKQSLANLYLRLAGIQTTPNSIVDDKAVLDALQVPDRQSIIA